MWFIFVILFILLLVLVSTIYICKCIKQYKFFNKINNKLLRILIALIPILLLFVFFKTMDAFIILIHLGLFIGISNLLINITNKIRKKQTNSNIKTTLGILLTIIYMVIGVYLNYHVFETKYIIETNKDIGSNRFRIIQISDSHIGTTFNGKGFEKHIDKISKIDTDIFVITGDFVDDNTTKKDMISACKALSKIHPKYGSYFVFGNHDKGYYNDREFNEEELKNELAKNNVIVLEDGIVNIDNKISIIGRKDYYDTTRSNIEDLISKIDKDNYIIDLNHEPNDYDNESKANVDLVLSGHTHGGQLFPVGQISTLLNMNDAYYGLEKRNNTNFIVSSGISDWEMSFKTGTKSEYVIIDIKN